MALTLPSASAAHRAMECTESFSLPWAEGDSSNRARRGTSVHVFLRNVLSEEMTREEALALVPLDDPGRRACEEADLDQLPRGGEHEVAMAWNPETDQARVLGHDIGRNYEAYGADRLREFVGSYDLVGRLRDRRGFVLDFKSGRPQWSARESWQLRTGAIKTAKILRVDEVLTGHIIVNDSEVRWDLYEIDAFELRDYENQLRRLARKMRKMNRRADLSEADVREGEHCKYCPAASRCPAKTALARSIALDMNALPKPFTEALTPEYAAKAWRILDRYDSVAKLARAEIEKLAVDAPLDLGDGFELRAAPGDERDVITDPVKAIMILEREIGVKGALGAAGTSKKALTAAAKAAGGEDMVRRVLSRLRDAGVLEKRAGEVKVRELRK